MSQHFPLPPTCSEFRGCRHPTCHEFRGCSCPQVCPQPTLMIPKGSHAPCLRSHQFRGCTARSRQPITCQATQPNENAFTSQLCKAVTPPSTSPRARTRAQVATAAAQVAPLFHAHQITSAIQCNTTFTLTRLHGGSHETTAASTRYDPPLTTHHTTGE